MSLGANQLSRFLILVPHGMVSLKTSSANVLSSIVADERSPPATLIPTRTRTKSTIICGNLELRHSKARLALYLLLSTYFLCFLRFPIPPTSPLFSITLYSRYPILTALVSSLKNNPLHSAVGIIWSSSITMGGLALDFSWVLFHYHHHSPFVFSLSGGFLVSFHTFIILSINLAPFVLPAFTLQCGLFIVCYHHCRCVLHVTIIPCV